MHSLGCSRANLIFVRGKRASGPTTFQLAVRIMLYMQKPGHPVQSFLLDDSFEIGRES